MSNGNGSVLNVPVEFGGVSIGDQTASVGCRIDRAQMKLGEVDKCLCGKRLTGKIQIDRNADDSPGQQTLPGIERDSGPQVPGSFDVKRIGMSPKDYSFRATFSLGEINIEDLSHFAKAKGRLIVEGIGEIPEDAPGGDERDEREHPDVRLGKDKPLGTPALAAVVKARDAKAADPAGRKSLFELVSHGATEKRVEKLIEALGCKTIAAFEKIMATDIWWHKKVKGIGTGGVDQISDAMVSFRKAYPIPTIEDAPAKPTNQKERSARLAGEEAAAGGQGRTDCPYGDDDPRQIFWFEGFDETFAGIEKSGDVFEQGGEDE